MISDENQIDNVRGGCFLRDMYKVGYARFAQRPLIELVRLRWDDNCPSLFYHQICVRELFWHITFQSALEMNQFEFWSFFGEIPMV